MSLLMSNATACGRSRPHVLAYYVRQRDPSWPACDKSTRVEKEPLPGPSGNKQDVLSVTSHIYIYIECSPSTYVFGTLMSRNMRR